MVAVMDDFDAEERPVHQGCMAGFLHLFDRPQILSGRRLHHAPRRLLSSSSGSATPSERSMQLGQATPAPSSPDATPPAAPRPSLQLPPLDLKDGGASSGVSAAPSWRLPRLSLDSRAVVDGRGKYRPREIRTPSPPPRRRRPGWTTGGRPASSRGSWASTPSRFTATEGIQQRMAGRRAARGSSGGRRRSGCRGGRSRRGSGSSTRPSSSARPRRSHANRGRRCRPSRQSRRRRGGRPDVTPDRDPAPGAWCRGGAGSTRARFSRSPPSRRRDTAGRSRFTARSSGAYGSAASRSPRAISRRSSRCSRRCSSRDSSATKHLLLLLLRQCARRRPSSSCARRTAPRRNHLRRRRRG
ncbi:hypothetical protein PR202_gb13048 [Eleusine coracana subsp. coracana]|uniref:Uncharacterized protein n=1 Tax=Eleusine coracana subsp. coracana TaxID=191504 RepID=A0AAV5EQY7_ELECO|nr:hypothetical protein PR202_gb13048 [Eleusine coracana subsp. coracana]